MVGLFKAPVHILAESLEFTIRFFKAPVHILAESLVFTIRFFAESREVVVGSFKTPLHILSEGFEFLTEGFEFTVRPLKSPLHFLAKRIKIIFLLIENDKNQIFIGERLVAYFFLDFKDLLIKPTVKYVLLWCHHICLIGHLFLRMRSKIGKPNDASYAESLDISRGILSSRNARKASPLKSEAGPFGARER